MHKFWQMSRWNLNALEPVLVFALDPSPQQTNNPTHSRCAATPNRHSANAHVDIHEETPFKVLYLYTIQYGQREILLVAMRCVKHTNKVISLNKWEYNDGGLLPVPWDIHVESVFGAKISFRKKNFNPVTSIFTNVGYFSKLMFIVLSIK